MLEFAVGTCVRSDTICSNTSPHGIAVEDSWYQRLRWLVFAVGATVLICDLGVLLWDGVVCGAERSLYSVHTPHSSCAPCSQYLFKSVISSSLKGANSVFLMWAWVFTWYNYVTEPKKMIKITGLLLGMALSISTFYSHWRRRVCEIYYSPWDGAKTVCVHGFSARSARTALSWGTRAQWHVLSRQTTEKTTL